MIPFSAASSWARSGTAGDRGSQHGGGSQRGGAPKHKTSECSDSDGDESNVGTETATFSPVPRSQLSTVVVLGADGNLASKKILPTLFKLWKRRMVPRDTIIIGYARKEMTNEQFRKQVFRSIYDPRQPQTERKEFQERCHYAYGGFGDVDSIRGLTTLATTLEAKRVTERRAAARAKGAKAEDVALEASNDLLVRMYYMAVPPFLYADICGALRACRAEALAAAPTDGSPAATWPVERFVLEKPFGRDTASCAALFGQLSMISEEETFRIDHYLGKELVRAPALDPKAEPRSHVA